MHKKAIVSEYAPKNQPNAHPRRLSLHCIKNGVLIDPTCGSGSFLLAIINRIRNERNLPADQLLSKIINGVWGFDLNPLAVQTSRVNYLIAISDLLLEAPGIDVEIPVLLADAIYAPAPDPDGDSQIVNYVIGSNIANLTISLPTELAQNRIRLDEAFAAMERCIETDATAVDMLRTTKGFSVSGNYALGTTERMVLRVSQGTNGLLKEIQTNEKRLSILKSQYYDFAIRWQIDLQFGNTAKKVFDEYQEKVSLFFSNFSTATLQKLNAIEDLMEDGNPERYSQVLTSCRRLWEDVAKQLFEEVLPDYKAKIFKTKSGVDIDVSGDHYNNKLSALIETLQSKAAKNTLVGSEIIYLVDWMEQINKLQSSGVHSDITRDQAMQCIIHTYIALGDILKLKDSAVPPN